MSQSYSTSTLTVLVQNFKRRTFKDVVWLHNIFPDTFCVPLALLVWFCLQDVFFLSAQLADKTIAAGLGVDNKQNLISMNQKFHFQALRRQVAQKNQA